MNKIEVFRLLIDAYAKTEFPDSMLLDWARDIINEPYVINVIEQNLLQEALNAMHFSGLVKAVEQDGVDGVQSDLPKRMAEAIALKVDPDAGIHPAQRNILRIVLAGDGSSSLSAMPTQGTKIFLGNREIDRVVKIGIRAEPNSLWEATITAHCKIEYADAD